VYSTWLRDAPRDRWLILVGLVLLLTIFLIDLQLPLGAATGMLYVSVILLGLWARSIAYAVVAAALATVLTMVDLALGWSETPSAVVYVNRPLMTLTYWVTAVLVVRASKLQARAAAQLKQLADLKYALDEAAIVATTDVTGRITYVNDKFCAISGYSREELIGQDHRIINSAFHPPEFIRDLWRTIASGDVWHGELRNRAKNGSYYWVDTTIVPFLTERGKPYQYTAIRSDITKRKAAEARLREQESLARLGQMAAVVAHEVKNPLAGVKGAIEIIRSRRPVNDPDLPIMREIVSRIDALNELIQDLLLFARPPQPRLTPLELRALLLDILAALRSDPAYRGIEASLEGPACPLLGDRELLRAAFFNLFLNACQAMGGHGRLTIQLTPVDESIRVEVSDQGPGIPAELRDKIFEPFFTTKHHGGGLGLPITARSVALHGGSLALSCPPEGGTIMTVTLPAKPANGEAPPAGSRLEMTTG
jgi:PAS domain S-box-containing protein